MVSRKTVNAANCHVRIYSSDKLLVAMDADVDGNRLAKALFEMINSGEYDE